MVAVSFLEQLQYLVDVKSRLDCVDVSWNHVAKLTEFIFNAPGASVNSVLSVVVLAHNLEVINSLAMGRTSNFVDEDIYHFRDEVFNVQLVDHKRMCCLGYFLILDIGNRKQHV